MKQISNSDAATIIRVARTLKSRVHSPDIRTRNAIRLLAVLAEKLARNAQN